MRTAGRTITVAGVTAAAAAVGEHLGRFGPDAGSRHLSHLGATVLIALVPALVAAFSGTRRDAGATRPPGTAAGTAKTITLFALLFLPLIWLVRRPGAGSPATEVLTGGGAHTGHAGAVPLP